MDKGKVEEKELDNTEETIFVPEGAESSGLMIEKNLWVPDKSVNQWFECYKEFNIFLRKHHCRIWGHIFCHQCSITRKLKRTKGKPQKYRFCYNCIEINTKFQEQIRANYGLIKTFRKNANVNYSTVIPEDGGEDVELINTERPINNHYHDASKYAEKNKKGLISELNTKRVTDIFHPKGNIKDATKSSITEEFIQMQEEELRNRFRANSFVQNFKNIMEENQNESTKYSAQEINIAKEQVKCKNEIIDKIIDRYINEYEIEKEKWGDILKDFAKRASESIKPSGFMLDDELDINILWNEWGTYLDSTYINGVVVKKNVIDRRLNATHENPRILLLSNNLGYARNDTDFTDFQSSIKQEDHFVEIIKEKIGRVRPNIVVVEGDVNKKFQMFFVVKKLQ